MIEARPDPRLELLKPYASVGFNKHTGRKCDAVVLEAWSEAGALVKRRCKQCGTWNLIDVRPGPPLVLDRPRSA